MSDLLKPCPFCGSPKIGVGASQEMDDAGEYIEEGRQWTVLCSGCGASSSLYSDSEVNAVTAWNTRVGHAPETFNPEADIAKMLQDPAVVHLNMLRGGIAKPSWANIKHLYPEQFAENANSTPTPSTANSDVAVYTISADALAQINDGLDVDRWIKLWESDGRKIDTTIAIAFYHQALQDARALLPVLGNVTPTPSDAMTVDAEELAIWLHNETDHPEHCPGYTWPENEHDDGRREGGFVKIVPKYAQEYFRDIARRMIAGPLSRHER